jgi:hypothetical protein
VRWDRGFSGWWPTTFTGKLAIWRDADAWRASIHFNESASNPELASLKVDGHRVELVFRTAAKEDGTGQADLELVGWIRGERLVGEMRSGTTVPWGPFGGRRKGAATVPTATALTEGAAPKGWLLSGSDRSDYAAAVDTSVKHGGQASGSLRSTTAHAKGFGTLMQSVVKDAYRGKRLRFSAMVKADQVANWAGLWMRVDRPNQRTGAFDNMEERAIKGTKDWARYEVVLDVDADASDVAFGVLLSGAGQVWIDDAALEVVGKDVAPTTKAWPSETKNLDFETAPPTTDGAPPPWAKWGDKSSEYAIAWDPSVKHAGRGSGSLRAIAASPKGFGALTQTIAATAYRGKRVRLTGFLKTADVKSWAGMWMRVDDVDHPTSAFDNMKDRPLKGTTDWTRCEVVLDVSRDAKDIAFGSVLDGAGQVWLDDASLAVVDGSVATTGGAKPKDAENLDFEQ